MKKLTVVVFEMEGALARMSTALADANVNLLDIDVKGTESIGVAIITVSDEEFETAHEALRESGHQVMPQEVLLVKLEDKPGGLAQLAVKLADAKVNVRSMRIVKREDDYCLAAIVPEPVDIARAVLIDVVVAG
ncbi:MAG: ACT domain-containing protein [Rickettsiales bacterium]|nr:ACT domain-containing protein [Rickettsiales bacterium]